MFEMLIAAAPVDGHFNLEWHGSRGINVGLKLPEVLGKSRGTYSRCAPRDPNRAGEQVDPNLVRATLVPLAKANRVQVAPPATDPNTEMRAGKSPLLTCSTLVGVRPA